MQYTAKNLIAIASAEVGYKEKKTNASLDSKTANAGSGNFTKYARDLRAKGYYNGNKNGFDWCDVFVDWCFLQLTGEKASAEAMEHQTGTLGAGCKYSMNYYKAAKAFDKTPRIGDQVFFGTSTSVQHTGIVENVDTDKIYTIEGNASDQVMRKSYKRNYTKILGYGHPEYEKPKTTLDLNDIVTFVGNTHYTNSQAATGKTCKAGMAKVTAIRLGAKHPYHLIKVSGGCTVYGWVDAKDIAELND